MKSIHTFLNQFLVIGVQTESPFPLFNLWKIITLDNNTEVKKVMIRPIPVVTAKPLIGPVPKINNTNAVNNEVR